MALARALMSNAGIILLDEPFAHLDSGNTHEIEKGLLAIEGKTLVNVSHVIDNENAAQYDEVWYIENKNITKFSPYILLNEIKIVQCNEYLCCFLFVFVNLLTQNHINGIIQKSKNVNMNKIRLQYMKKMSNYAWVKAAARDFVLFQHQEQEVKKCGRNNYWQVDCLCIYAHWRCHRQ